MTRSPPSNRVLRAGGRSARHGLLPTVSDHAVGAAAAPPAVAAPPQVSTAICLPVETAAPPTATPPVAVVLTTFEGQAVFRILSPGSSAFRAGDLLRFAYGSRTTRERPQ